MQQLQQQYHLRQSDKAMFPATSMPDIDWWHSLWPNPTNVVQSMGVEPGMTVTDLCCGDGYFTIPMAMKASKVYGLELDSDLFERAKNCSFGFGVTNCHWILGDAMHAAELIPEKSDLVLMANTFHGIPDKLGMIRVISDLLKPGGKIAVINWHKIPREETIVFGLPRGPKTELRMSIQDTSDMLTSAGFILKNTVDVSPYHYMSIYDKIPSE